MLRLFTREGRENDKLPPGLADAIFQEDPLRTRQLLVQGGLIDPERTVEGYLELIVPYMEARLKADTQRRRGVTMDQIDNKSDLNVDEKRRARAEAEIALLAEEQRRRAEVAVVNAWEPSYMPPPDDSSADHSYWLTALTRVAFSRVMLELTPRDSKADGILREKAARWLNRHVPLLRYMDSGVREVEGEPYSDADVDVFRFADSYVPLGTTSYPDDQDTISRHAVYIKRARRPQPDEVLFAGGGKKFTLPALRTQATWVRKLLQGDGPPPHQIEYSREELVTWLVEGTRTKRGELSYYDDMRLPWLQCKQFAEDAGELLAHCIWISVLLNLQKLSDIRASSDGYYDAADKDAAYQWQLAHLDLADICERAGRYDDDFLLQVDPRAKLSPLEAYYPYPGRSFHEGNLPDLTSVMELIALYGEKYLPEFDIARLFGKSVKCACMRRHLTNVTVQSIHSNAAFWAVFSKLMLCMLWGTYARSENRLHGDTALAMMRLCRDSDEMSRKLKRQPYKSCMIIFIAVRLYMVFYGNLNTPYSAAADKVIYWFELQEDTRAMASIVRGSNLLAEDVFAEARVYLERHCKNSNSLVYRYRAGGLAGNLFTTCIDSLEKGLWMELEYARRDVATMEQMAAVLFNELPVAEHAHLWEACRRVVGYADEVRRMDPVRDPERVLDALQRAIAEGKRNIEEYGAELDKDIKSNILNMLLVVPQHLRYAPETFALLCREEYGGLDPAVPESLVKLVRIYYDCGAPKEAQQQLANFRPHDLRVTSWFFHCCKIYERIRLVRLDASTQERIERAMKMTRYQLYPGAQQLRDKDFVVYVTVCCNRIATERDGSYGHNDVRYDVGDHTVVCKRGTKQKDVLAIKAYEKPVHFPLLARTEAEMKDRATQRKNHHLRISCPQPALPICIRGYRLMLGLTRDNIKSYQHCPQCGSPTQVFLAGYTGIDGYMCMECLKEDKSRGRAWSCAYCQEAVHPRYVKDPNNDRRSHWHEPDTCVTVLRGEEIAEDYESNPTELLQDIFLCRPHYRTASALLRLRVQDRSRGKASRWMNKQTLFRLLGEAHMRNAVRNMDIRYAKRGIAKDK